jgi:hypothetical protein
MADNLGYTPGSGETVATDEIAGAHYQRIKPYWGGEGIANEISEASPMPVRDDDTRGFLSRILQILLAPLGYDKSLQRYRQTAVIESGTVTTVTTVTTCSTVTNLSTIDTLQGRILVYGANMSAWSDCVRSRIT